MKTNQLLIVMTALLAPLLSKGQVLESYWVNEIGWRVDSTEASYKRAISQGENGSLLYEDRGIVDEIIYGSGSVIARTRPTDNTTSYLRNGLCTEYHANGQKKLEGSYRDGGKEGNFIAWYADGSKKGQYLYEKSEWGAPSFDHEFRVLEFFDSLGNKQVDEGKGVFWDTR